MKVIFKEYLSKNSVELSAEVKKELLAMAKNLTAISLGQEKKTHLLSLKRKKIAVLETLISQKKFLEKI